MKEYSQQVKRINRQKRYIKPDLPTRKITKEEKMRNYV